MERPQTILLYFEQEQSRMISSETWGVAIEALRANKVKAALTMLGVVIGSACIVLVVTIAPDWQELRHRPDRSRWLQPDLCRHILTAAPRRLPTKSRVADMNAARELPHVVEVAGTNDFTRASVVVDGKEKPVSLIGVTEGFQKIRNLLILKGRFFDDVDMQTGAKACLITQDLAKQYHEDMIGKEIRVGELRFTVIAVFRERVATFGQSEIASGSVLIPFAVDEELLGARTTYAPCMRRRTRRDNVLLVTERGAALIAVET